jgi:hypothetical protein
MLHKWGKKTSVQRISETVAKEEKCTKFVLLIDPYLENWGSKEAFEAAIDQFHNIFVSKPLYKCLHCQQIFFSVKYCKWNKIRLALRMWIHLLILYKTNRLLQNLNKPLQERQIFCDKRPVSCKAIIFFRKSISLFTQSCASCLNEYTGTLRIEGSVDVCLGILCARMLNMFMATLCVYLLLQSHLCVPCSVFKLYWICKSLCL